MQFCLCCLKEKLYGTNNKNIEGWQVWVGDIDISAKNSLLLTEVTGGGFELKKLKKVIINGVKQLNRQPLFSMW